MHKILKVALTGFWGLASLTATAQTGSETYPLSFDKTKRMETTQGKLKRFGVWNSGTLWTYVKLNSTGTPAVYEYDNSTVIQRSISNQQYIAPWLECESFSSDRYVYLYVDYNMDGKFNADTGTDGELISKDLLAKGKTSLYLAERHLPNSIKPGTYRARLKIDGDNNAPEGSSEIARNGGKIVDFYITLYAEKEAETVPITLETRNGNIYDGAGGALPLGVSRATDLKLKAVPVSAGYTIDKVKVSQYDIVEGVLAQHPTKTTEITPSGDGTFTVDRQYVEGALTVEACYHDEDAEWKLIFNDEFNTPDGTLPDKRIWSHSQRWPSVQWARFLKDSPKVAFVKDGKMVFRCIPKPEGEADDAAMWSGGIESSKRFNFKHGRLECRALTNRHTGNFPAIWMMPENGLEWPQSGEIDIFEQIDSENYSYHTVHTDWTNKGNKKNPQSSISAKVNMDRYHTYAVEWEEDIIKWFVDGRQVATYSKASLPQSAVNAWPFNDRNFYIILNQSAGNGSWAKNADTSHTYETQMDWVRVYQKKEKTTTRIGDLEYIITSADSMNVAVRAAKGAVLKDVVVPATVEIGGKTYKVTTFTPNAFKGQNQMTSLTIKGNTRLNELMLEDCTALTEIKAEGLTPESIPYMELGETGNISLSTPAESAWLYNATDGWNKFAGKVSLNENQYITVPQAQPKKAVPAAVTFERKFKQGWNSLCLPVSLTMEEVRNIFGNSTMELDGKESVRLVEMNPSRENGTIFYNKVPDRLEAGKPYCIYFFFAPEKTHYDLGNRMLRTGNPESVESEENGNVFIFSGNYNTIENLAEADHNGKIYFLKNNQFYYATSKGKIKLKGYRAYVKGDAKSSFAPQFYGNFETNGIDNAVEQQATHDSTTYTLQGIKLNVPETRLSKGIYIINGKKVCK